ncbi:hypothetical protein PaG_04536 [Moesziomyces aphidis]|uniref:Uncharacterized protein n=1 Tax=Moesziomyces aphidis TaxID=84754 RepID=W3VKJ4_MOEAP|nr:hypothetical protein PaG_04536 [Moesziomyces aphidis]
MLSHAAEALHLILASKQASKESESRNLESSHARRAALDQSVVRSWASGLGKMMVAGTHQTAISIPQLRRLLRTGMLAVPTTWRSSSSLNPEFRALGTKLVTPRKAGQSRLRTTACASNEAVPVH